jgi:hypothetical protein
MAQAKDIKEKVLWVIQSSENQKGGGGTDLRIIQWIVDGKPGRPMLEKRDWFLDYQGDRKAGKAKGMTAGDLYQVIKNLRAIAKLLEVKQNHLDEALQMMDFTEAPKSGTSATAGASASRPSSSTTKKTQPSTSSPEDTFRQAPAMAGSVPDQQF